MHRTVHQNQVVVLGLKPIHATGSSMRRSVVYDPVNATCLGIWRLTHHLVDQSVKCLNARVKLTAPEDFGPMYIPCRQISPSSATIVTMLDSHGTPRLSRLSGMHSSPGLNAGFLVRRQHELISLQCLSIPHPLVKVQHPTGLGLKLRVPREDPTAVLPWFDRVLVQPAPDRASADRGYQSRVSGAIGQLRRTPTSKRYALLTRQFTGQCFDGHDRVRGKKTLADQDAGVLQVPPTVPGRSAYARG